ncbi:phage integrase family protein,site-specific tyrosine recombinase XerC,Site-specific recombinase XerD,tyrosine recombinase XerD,Phage integrase family [[Clostridium] sordellii]|uniref:tyrosine-type recombinase/integrase n=1 Tax=Paraclostridium sordellii TaxID=1505 RepID=UPI0005429F2B|nr:tyrosine-type recombinase/integrase [Paeniclostridium sordellii]CEK34285.1 phage integrase family protein,site-specific tyrosine recombinase XerC,Site-specific recombinase XerD,tyrosine recombinase XerD,Phage integrase family [[Clostridium] sordellii] [Paeniclostridium sordellii]
MREKQAKKRKRAPWPIMHFEQVLDIADYLETNSSRFGKRNKMLFTLGCTTGYRAGDLVELKVRDVKNALDIGYFIIYENKVNKNGQEFEKKKKPRTVEIVPEVAELLYEYIEGKENYEYMFPSNKKNSEKKHITVECISKEIKKAAKFFGLDNITAHSMRKTFGWDQYVSSGHNIEYVRDLFNHKSSEYTKWYIMINEIESKKYKSSLSKFASKFR